MLSVKHQSLDHIYIVLIPIASIIDLLYAAYSIFNIY
jgi:hypothetical protein